MEKVRSFCKTFDFFDIRQDFDNESGSLVLARDAIRGKTGKTVVLRRFCKIEHGGGSGGALPSYRGIIWLGCTGHASGAPAVASTLVTHPICVAI